MQLELIRNETHSNEHTCVNKMMYYKVLTEKERKSVLINSKKLVSNCSLDKGGGEDLLDSFLQYREVEDKKLWESYLTNFIFEKNFNK